MIDRASKAVFHTLAASTNLKQIASRYGMRRPNSFARRFIAGETVDEAIAAARTIEAAGMRLTLDYLGESVGTMGEAERATKAYLAVIDRIGASGVERNISLKLTQLGLTIDRATSVDNVRRILDAGNAHGFFVRLDMENSPFTQVTLDIFETIWQQGYRNAGVVLQSYLPRSTGDARRMNALGARVRLVKGAYKEPRSVAYQSKADVDAAFVGLMHLAVGRGHLSRDRHARSRDARGDSRVRRPRRDRAGPLRVPDAVRHQARSAVGAGAGRLSAAGLRPVRPRMVPVLHASAGRTACEHRVRAQKSGAGRILISATRVSSSADM